MSSWRARLAILVPVIVAHRFRGDPARSAVGRALPMDEQATANNNEGYMMAEVKLIAEYRNGQPVYEAVPATQVGANRYRLTASPGFAAGVASGDDIELAPQAPLGYRVVKRGGNVCIQLFL